MAAGLFGAILESVLFDSGPSEADKEQARRQQEAERQRAEAERQAAIERAREAEEKHRKLLNALTPMLDTTSTGTSASPTNNGIRLIALDTEDSVPSKAILSTPDMGGVPDFPTDEAAREWLASPESLFISTWKPLPVAPKLPVSPTMHKSCTNSAQGCKIVLPTKPAVPIVRTKKIQQQHLSPPSINPSSLGTTVTLLRPSTCKSPCDDEAYYIRAWGAAGLPPEQTRSATLITLIDRLQKTGKILIESAAMMALDAAPNENLSAGIKVIYNVREAADTVLSDAIKVAGYAGTPNAKPVDTIPLEETAAPFAGDPEDLRKLISGSQDKNKTINTLVVESAWLAQKLRRVWVTQP